jgi:hypothetical protein
MSPLRQSELDAVALADDLRALLFCWFRRRGVRVPPFGVSAYVNAADQPSVVIRMEAYAARSLALSLDEQRQADGRRRSGET